MKRDVDFLFHFSHCLSAKYTLTHKIMKEKKESIGEKRPLGNKRNGLKLKAKFVVDMTYELWIIERKIYILNNMQNYGKSFCRFPMNCLRFFSLCYCTARIRSLSTIRIQLKWNGMENGKILINEPIRLFVGGGVCENAIFYNTLNRRRSKKKLIIMK